MRRWLVFIALLTAPDVDAATLYVNSGHASCDNNRAKASVTAELP